MQRRWPNASQVGSSLIPDFGPAWDAAYRKAKSKVRRMTIIITGAWFPWKISSFSLGEKVSVTTGVGWMNGRCVVNLKYSWRPKSNWLLIQRAISLVLTQLMVEGGLAYVSRFEKSTSILSTYTHQWLIRIPPLVFVSLILLQVSQRE